MSKVCVIEDMPTYVNNPIRIDLIIKPHLGEQADDRFLIFSFGLLDDAARDKLVEYLPHGLRMIGF